MPRKPLIRTSDFPYHVTTRSNHKEWFKIPLDEVWEISVNAFHYALKKYHVEIYQYVLMHNHYHMLIRTPESNIDKFMYLFNKDFSEKLRSKSGYVNRMFGGNYHPSLITDDRYLQTAFRYVYQNPVRARMVGRAENYPYSTLFFLERNIGTPFPIVLPEIFGQKINHSELSSTLLSEDEVLSIRKGFQKEKFKEVFPRKY